MTTARSSKTLLLIQTG